MPNEKRYLIHHYYQDHSGSGVMPFTITAHEKWIIEQLETALYGFPQEIEFVEVKEDAQAVSSP